MHIDNDKINQLVNILEQYFATDNINEIANVEFPCEIEYRSIEWLNYIFYSCLLDYGMRSKIYHQNLINTYHKHKDLFNPNYVLKKYSKDSSDLYNLIKDNIHPRYPNVAVNKWLKLSGKLSEYDNLLEKIKSFKTFEELNYFIKNISGYGQKTGGLLLRLIYESNICVFADDLSTIPLDRHDIEISYLNGIIDIKNLNAKQISDLSTAYIKCGNKLKIKPNIIDKYLWEIGSKFCNKKDCVNCPLYSNCFTKIKCIVK